MKPGSSSVSRFQSRSSRRCASSRKIEVYPYLDRMVSIDELIEAAIRSDYLYVMHETTVTEAVVAANPNLKGNRRQRACAHHRRRGLPASGSWRAHHFPPDAAPAPHRWWRADARSQHGDDPQPGVPHSGSGPVHANHRLPPEPDHGPHGLGRVRQDGGHDRIRAHCPRHGAIALHAFEMKIALHQAHAASYRRGAGARHRNGAPTRTTSSRKPTSWKCS